MKLTNRISTIAATLLAAYAVADTADDKLAEIKALKPPAIDRTKGSDAAYQKQVAKDFDSWISQRGKLIWAFADAYPDNPDTPRLVGSHWSSLKGPFYPVANDRIESAIRAINADLAARPKPTLVALGKYYIATYRDLEAGDDAKKLLVIADGFTKAYPKDPNGVNLIRVAAEATKDPTQKALLYQRIVDGYPESPLTPMFKGTVRRLQAVGKPFAISFTDAISGKNVSSQTLKGKVVLVDYWATWCQPCLVEVPARKKLYADYKGQGLEIVGVSLDQPEKDGGLKALKEFVVSNAVDWPQYYQGKGWESEFSAGWGIMEIPTAFLVDKKGVLRSVDAGKNLEAQIQALLKE